MGDPRFKKEYEEFTARFQQERREKDEEVTSRIKGLTDNGDKVLVFYGADHIKRLAEELGFANVQGIYIVNSERSNPYEDLPELDRS